jgi:hypothetical protein
VEARKGLGNKRGREVEVVVIKSWAQSNKQRCRRAAKKPRTGSIYGGAVGCR